MAIAIWENETMHEEYRVGAITMTDRTNYIDRQAAYEVLTAYYHHKTDIQHAALHEALNRVPSAERHGKWIHDGYDFPHGVDWMHCSECGKIGVYCPAAMTNYCPNCGARMDG